MITVDGRILPPPTISYGGNSNVSSAAGSWNMIKQRFCVGAKIQSWTYLEVREGSRSLLYEPLIDLMKEFRRMMQTCGLDVAVPNPPTGLPAAEILAGPHPSNETKLDGYFSRIAQKKEASMLLIVLPAKLQGLYSIIKYLTDVKYGLHTVCCVAAKLGNDRGRPQYLANVALKWNLKRGGVNQQVSPGSLGILTKTRTMVVGIDVTHPSPGSMEEAPSVAGVVASINDRFAQWPASVRIQKGREEMVQELDAMMEQRLRTYQRLSGNLPQNILVYRDGVSEGQYARVLDEESPQIQKAIGRVYPANAIKPKVSIIIVGKRHHTRFYPTREDEADRSGNPKNGTVVDRGVTGERQWDFFLQAHMGLQGTARPAHYVVIQDGIGLGVDGLEQMVRIVRWMRYERPRTKTDMWRIDRPTVYVICLVVPPKLSPSVLRLITPIFYANVPVAISRTFTLHRSGRVVRPAARVSRNSMRKEPSGARAFIRTLRTRCSTFNDEEILMTSKG